MTTATYTLPVGFTVRAPREDDLPTICALLAAFDIAYMGFADAYEPADIREEWERLDLTADTWVIEGLDGRMAGYGTLTDEGSGRLGADGYVHPNYWGRGVGTALVRLMDTRAAALVDRAPAGARVVVGNAVLANDAAAQAILEAEGYSLVRTHWRMAITLDAPPLAPDWPAGIAVRAFAPGRDDRAIFEAIEEAFTDHWGHTPRAFEEWITRTKREDFDPSLWFLAMDGDTIAGVALCRRRPDCGWLSTLAVRRPWRKRGLGLALLRHSFGAFYARRERTIALGVDAQNLTGATRLYEGAGMRVTMRAAIYEKELRPGVDLAVRALSDG